MTNVMPPRPLPIPIAALVAASILAGAILAIVVADLGGLTFFLAFAGTGAYLVVQRPRNSVGWLLVLAGCGFLMGTVHVVVPPADLLAGTLTPAQALTAWANACGWSFVFLAFLGITLVFPSGRLPQGRGRWPSRIALGVSGALAALIGLGPLIGVTQLETGLSLEVPNPFAIAPDAAWWAIVPSLFVLFFAMFALVVVGVVFLVVRARGALGFERLQYRWLIAAIAFASAANVLWVVQAQILRSDVREWPVNVVVLLAYITVPLAIVIAITRYRLFDIDRIISRTIAYGGSIVVLGGVFAAGVLLLSSALASIAQGQSIAVAASTLLTYAILQPVAGRIRRDVDRRFDRTRYDAERTVLSFADRLRHETNVEAVSRDLAATTQAVVAPTSTSLWLRPRGTER